MRVAKRQRSSMQEFFVGVTLLPILTLCASDLWVVLESQNKKSVAKDWGALKGCMFQLWCVTNTCATLGFAFTWILYAFYPVPPWISVAYIISCFALSTFNLLLHRQPSGSESFVLTIFNMLAMEFLCYIAIAAVFAIQFDVFACGDDNGHGAPCGFVALTFVLDLVAILHSFFIDLVVWYPSYKPT